MKVLILGPKSRNQPILDALINQNVDASIVSDICSISSCELVNFSHLISSGYHKRISVSILEKFNPRNRLNVHASFLPFGKGIGTILFALLYPVPLGSTIHILDPEIDQGDILIQECFEIPDYVKSQRILHGFWVKHASELFIKNMMPLLQGSINPVKQVGTYKSPYLTRDESEVHLSLLTKGWDTPLDDLMWLSHALALRAAAKTFFDN